MPSRRTWSFCGLAVLLAACADATGPRAALITNRLKWNTHRLTDYTYRLRITCYCPPEFTEPVEITVHGRAVQGVASAATGTPLSQEQAAYFQITVDSLFGWLETALSEAAAVIVADYDASLGYPRNVHIDYAQPAVDDEIGFIAQLLPR